MLEEAQSKIQELNLANDDIKKKYEQAVEKEEATDKKNHELEE